MTILRPTNKFRVCLISNFYQFEFFSKKTRVLKKDVGVIILATTLNHV